MLYRNAVPCLPHNFQELWAALQPKPPTDWRVAELLLRVQEDARRRSGIESPTRFQFLVQHSASGCVDPLDPPPSILPAYCYTFDAFGSAPRRLKVSCGASEQWEAVVGNGDLLEYRRGKDGTFGLGGATDVAHCNGRRIVVTVFCK